jgi:hypothetical protein
MNLTAREILVWHSHLGVSALEKKLPWLLFLPFYFLFSFLKSRRWNIKQN